MGLHRHFGASMHPTEMWRIHEAAESYINDLVEQILASDPEITSMYEYPKRAFPNDIAK
jgi:hypothetical protein